jgi:hypothetical protein
MIGVYVAIEANKAALGFFAAAVQYAEMMVAAGKVVDQRTRMIHSASQSPLTGDYRELGKMVPEKVAAFGEAAEILTREWGVWQRSVTSQVTGALTAEPLTFASSQSLYGWVDAVTRLWAAPAKALAPIHKSATGNARRLQKR